MITITLPWPAQPLWPNRRHHWSVKAKRAKAYRQLAWGLLCEAQNTAPGATVGASRWLLTYEFCAPTRRSFDLDNALAAMKGATDGIADALCVNDKGFTFALARGEPVKGGAVKVQLTWAS